MTYDNAEEVKVLARRYGFQTRAVPMKNTHHAEMTELLVGRNLDWVDEGGIFSETNQKPQGKEFTPVNYRKRNKTKETPSSVDKPLGVLKVRSADYVDAVQGIQRGLDSMVAGKGEPAKKVLNRIRAKYKIPRLPK